MRNESVEICRVRQHETHIPCLRILTAVFVRYPIECLTDSMRHKYYDNNHHQTRNKGVCWFPTAGKSTNGGHRIIQWSLARRNLGPSTQYIEHFLKREAKAEKHTYYTSNRFAYVKSTREPEWFLLLAFLAISPNLKAGGDDLHLNWLDETGFTAGPSASSGSASTIPPLMMGMGK